MQFKSIKKLMFFFVIALFGAKIQGMDKLYGALEVGANLSELYDQSHDIRLFPNKEQREQMRAMKQQAEEAPVEPKKTTTKADPKMKQMQLLAAMSQLTKQKKGQPAAKKDKNTKKPTAKQQGPRVSHSKSLKTQKELQALAQQRQQRAKSTQQVTTAAPTVPTVQLGTKRTTPSGKEQQMTTLGWMNIKHQFNPKKVPVVAAKLFMSYMAARKMTEMIHAYMPNAVKSSGLLRVMTLLIAQYGLNTAMTMVKNYIQSFGIYKKASASIDWITDSGPRFVMPKARA